MIKTILKYLFYFEHQNHVTIFKIFISNKNNSVEMNINIQQVLFFSFLKKAVLKSKTNKQTNKHYYCLFDNLAN